MLGSSSQMRLDLLNSLKFSRIQSLSNAIQAESDYLNIINMATDVVCLLNPSLLPMGIGVKTALFAIYGMEMLRDTDKVERCNDKYRAAHQVVTTCGLAAVSTLPYAEVPKICIQTLLNIISSVVTTQMNKDESTALVIQSIAGK